MQVLKPDIVFLQIGSNDLCSSSQTPVKVANSIIDLADILVRSYSVKRVIIGQLLFWPVLR